VTADAVLPWLAGVWGLAIGSFLNVCILRLPAGTSIVFPPSRCPACGHRLAWFENVPVVSYLVLRRRCRSCRAPISWQYPLVEATTGVLFAAAAAWFGLGWVLLSRLVFISAMIVLFVIDLRHRILPNAITLPGIVVGFAFSLVADPGWTASAIGIVGGGGVLWAIAEAYYRLRHEEGLGMGDVKMLAMIGAFLGWKLMLLTLVLSSLVGAMVGVGLIAARRGDMKYALPYGTFLALAAVFAAFQGDAIVSWYVGFYS
jgi:leader peptidase (prepilin peptidase) / N-methyltransferase